MGGVDYLARAAAIHCQEWLAGVDFLPKVFSEKGPLGCCLSGLAQL
jgi:hypothetical protein